MKILIRISLIWTLIIFGSSILLSQGTMVLIDSQSSDWIDTSIPINAGDTIYIEASGFVAGVKSGQNINIFQFLGPAGMSTYLPTGNLIDDSSPMFSLIAKIGQSGDPFFIGNKTDIIIPSENGNLFMIVNDCVNCFWDNFGYYSAIVFKGDWVTTSMLSQLNHNPQEFMVSQNYPNPFNPSTSINYQIANPADVQITIYDINGQKVKDLVNEFKNAGEYSVTWDAKNNYGNKVASGTYFYQVQTDDFVQTKKMILIK